MWELSDASVPFDFKTHIMMPTEDPKLLEKALHEELAEYRLNKEFYRTDFAVILAAVEKHYGPVEVIDVPKTVEVAEIEPEKMVAPEIISEAVPERKSPPWRIVAVCLTTMGLAAILVIFTKKIRDAK